jgi:F-type H+-transporting ATPase subunit gamma
MENLEQAQARLGHIRTVEPIVSALRTISLGSWQETLGQREAIQTYAQRLTNILPLLIPHLPPAPTAQPSAERPGPAAEKPARPRVALLVIGSERGLVGAFNTAVVERAQRHADWLTSNDAEVSWMALGSRPQNLIQASLDWSAALPIARPPSFDLALDLTQDWLERYERQELDGVDVLYNAYQGIAKYEPSVTRVIPPDLPPTDSASAGAWPPPIIETDPLSLCAEVIQQWASITLYRLLLDSAAAEHSTRYQMMESATENAQELIDELTLVTQAARRRQITREMQELAVGAGLIDADKG